MTHPILRVISGGNARSGVIWQKVHEVAVLGLALREWGFLGAEGGRLSLGFHKWSSNLQQTGIQNSYLAPHLHTARMMGESRMG